MRTWPVQDAKARFSEMLETCLREGPQVVTKRGVDAAVLVPATDWQKLKRAARPTFKELLLSAGARGDLNVPPRGGMHRRRVHNLV
ncbi:MAG: type II toxin-antitoxin system Phd/YefM family antitoxin [Alphaproteobacteria bacterium]|nr:type II toxin-antitoxin system Phd/YefM family antitoxin [Alphaproteobacteria bacterium]